MLRNEKGQLLENVWQFAKIYRRVDAQRTKLSRFHPDTIIWTHGAEQHIVGEDIVTKEYWAWRRKGMANEYAVRYPKRVWGTPKCRRESLDRRRSVALARLYCGSKTHLLWRVQALGAVYAALYQASRVIGRWRELADRRGRRP